MSELNPFDLSPDQRAALDLTRNRMISASAGTGKTHTLTALYLGLLEGRIAPGSALLDEAEWHRCAQAGKLHLLSPQDVVAVTYTEKAASELIVRTKSALDAELRRAELPEVLRTHLADCREKLAGAPVSTIHAFCARLLREAGAEAPAPPAFSMLEGGEDGGGPSEAELLLERALIDAASELLEEKTDPHFLMLAREWRVLGDFALAGYARHIIAELRHRGAQPEKLTTAFDEKEALSIARVSLAEFFAAIRNIPEKGPRGQTPKPELRAICARKLELNSIEDLRRICCETQAFLYTGSKLFKWAEKAGISDPFGALLNTAHAPFANSFAAYLARVLERYRTSKHAAGGADFDDLLLLASELLTQRPAIRDGKPRYKFVLIDEFQDTNPLQKEILWRVAFPPGTSLKTDVRLAVVGDVKQSIYRFRGADYSVMRGAAGELAVSPLRMSFRSRRGVICFINKLFTQLWPGGEFHYDAAHELEPQLNAERHAWEGPAGELLDDDLSREKAVRADLRTMEADAIARRIRALVDPPDGCDLNAPKIWTKKGPRGRVRYGDIAILAASLRNLRVPLQIALGRMGIPFQMMGGSGFYRRQEVLDTINLLATVADSTDGFALAGFLRSPLIGLSDGGLFSLAENGRGALLYERLLAAANRPNDRLHTEDAAAIRNAAVLLDKLKAGLGRRTAAEIIDFACVETGFLATLALQPQGEAAVAAVRKIIELSRGFESRGARSLADFVEWLRERADAEWEDPGAEGPAAAPASEDAIHIGTIHKAKGLEFPIVFVADIAASVRSSLPSAAYHHKFGLGLRLGFQHEGVESSADLRHAAISEHDANEGEKERLRLLYVALTRARDYLILAGDRGRGETNWRALIESFLATDSNSLARVKYSHPVLQNAQQGAQPGMLDLSREEPRLKPDWERAPDDSTRSAAAKPAAPAAAIEARRDIQISVSQLAAWMSCPRRERLDRFAKMRAIPDNFEEPEVDSEDDENEYENTDQRALGTAAHAALEAVFSRQNLDSAARDRLIKSVFESNLAGETISKGQRQKTLALIQSLLNSSWGEAVLRLPSESRHAERPLRYRFRVDEKTSSTVSVIGKLDLLVHFEPRRVQIVDYKLSALPSEETRLRYCWQANVYALIASAILARPASEIESALIFLADENIQPQSLKMLGYHGAAASIDVVNAALREIWTQSAEFDWRKLPAQLWRPDANTPATREQKHCKDHGCPHVRRCFC